jgi:hypothetical protein
MLNPKWKRLASAIGPDVFTVTDRELKQRESTNLDATMIPQLATYHLNACLNASIEANRMFQPSVAICLIRQCVEALTIVDVGFQELEERDELLERWRRGKVTTGGLRKHLEVEAWPRYGPGLWDEPWVEFFSNLAQAVHPYAHYSAELLGWQQSIMAFDGGRRFLVTTGPQSREPLKASRIALLQALVIWGLARILLANCGAAEVVELQEPTGALATAIGSSKLSSRQRTGQMNSDHTLLFTQDRTGRMPKPAPNPASAPDGSAAGEKQER